MANITVKFKKSYEVPSTVIISIKLTEGQPVGLRVGDSFDIEMNELEALNLQKLIEEKLAELKKK